MDIRSKAVTIDDCLSLFATICHCSPLFALFETIRTIRDYSLFAIRDYLLFGFPDTRGHPVAMEDRTSIRLAVCRELWRSQP